MSPRSLALAWALCAGILLALGLGLTSLRATSTPVFAGAQIAVIGSSQTSYAFAKQGGGASSLLGDGRSHYRIGLPSISEPETLALLDRAIAERAELVLIEASLLAYELAGFQNRGQCDSPARQLRLNLKAWQRALTDPASLQLGAAASTDDGGEPADQARLHPGAFARQGITYAVSPRQLCDPALLTSLLSRAQAQGTHVALFMVPRSATAERLLGPATSATLDQAYRDMARKSGVPLIAPPSPWPDTQFVSIAHVAPAGRLHFQQALREAMGAGR